MKAWRMILIGIVVMRVLVVEQHHINGCFGLVKALMKRFAFMMVQFVPHILAIFWTAVDKLWRRRCGIFGIKIWFDCRWILEFEGFIVGLGRELGCDAGRKRKKRALKNFRCQLRFGLRLGVGLGVAFGRGTRLGLEIGMLERILVGLRLPHLFRLVHMRLMDGGLPVDIKTGINWKRFNNNINDVLANGVDDIV